MQPLAICGFLRKALVWRMLSTKVSVVVCGCSAQRRDSYTPELLPPKGNHQKGAKRSQKGAKGAKREPKEAKREPKIKKIIKNHVLERSKFSFVFIIFSFKL